MPLIEKSTYNNPWWLFSKHIQTIYPSRKRIVKGVNYTRKRIDTPDQDFLDLDLSQVGGENAVIILHGLGGHTNRAYMKGMIKAFNRIGWDGFAVNFRSCSGETNKQLRFYHSGETGDLHTVIQHIKESYDYKQIALIGFSLGGNVVTKYLGEQGNNIDSNIKAAVVMSVPCHLASSAGRLDSPANWIYRKRFLRMLHQTIRDKMRIMPDKLSDKDFHWIKTLREYDNRYTAPIHGFKDANDYYSRSSSRPFIPQIKIPTLMINALNDPFLGEACYPFEEAKQSDCFFLETPANGGHTGFASFNKKNEYWHEGRSISFIQHII
jgi:predicted alpha/beta-fold hydrolase